MKSKFLLNSLIAVFTLASSGLSLAAGKTYSEDQFLNSFSGKSKKVVLEKLGAPVKKELSVKPSNANMMVAGRGKESSNRADIRQ
jgi:hypothetical protein